MKGAKNNKLAKKRKENSEKPDRNRENTNKKKERKKIRKQSAKIMDRKNERKGCYEVCCILESDVM